MNFILLLFYLKKNKQKLNTKPIILILIIKIFEFVLQFFKKTTTLKSIQQVETKPPTILIELKIWTSISGHKKRFYITIFHLCREFHFKTISDQRQTNKSGWL